MKCMNELKGNTGTPARSNVAVDNRERISISGIVRVDSFDESEVSARCGSYGISVYGQGLHISRLDLDNGVLIIDGFINGVEYSDKDKKDGILSRIFK